MASGSLGGRREAGTVARGNLGGRREAGSRGLWPWEPGREPGGYRRKGELGKTGSEAESADADMQLRT